MSPDDLLLPSDALSPAGRGISVRWLGTAGFALELEGYVLLVDPYVTRASLARCAFGAVTPDLAAIARHTPRADAILVGHTHFDHALDVPAIARATGARVVGSRSLRALCRAGGVPDERIEVVEPDAAPWERELGPFRVRAHRSAHSKLALGRVPFAGEIDDCDKVPLRVSGYRCGAVLRFEIEGAGRRIAHVGSAELVDGPAAGETDLALLCVAGWTTSERLPERVLSSLRPRAVGLMHWDDFFRPLERGARALPAMRMPRLVEGLGRASREPAVGTLRLLEPLWV